jgi:hypothetical protein
MIKTFNVMPELKDFPAKGSEEIQKGPMFQYQKKNGPTRNNFHIEI